MSAAYDADGDVVVSVRLSAQDGTVLLAALVQAQDELDRQRAERLEVGEEDVSAETSGGAAAPAPAETPEPRRATLGEAQLPSPTACCSAPPRPP